MKKFLDQENKLLEAKVQRLEHELKESKKYCTHWCSVSNVLHQRIDKLEDQNRELEEINIKISEKIAELRGKLVEKIEEIKDWWE